MSLRFFHQVIVFAAIAVFLTFGVWCFFSPDVAGNPYYIIAGIVSGFVVLGLIGYEVYFLRKTRRLILS